MRPCSPKWQIDDAAAAAPVIGGGRLVHRPSGAGNCTGGFAAGLGRVSKSAGRAPGRVGGPAGMGWAIASSWVLLALRVVWERARDWRGRVGTVLTLSALSNFIAAWKSFSFTSVSHCAGCPGKGLGVVTLWTLSNFIAAVFILLLCRVG